jgi:nitroreductase
MNEVIEVIKRRRSCRCFDPERMPSEEVIAQICEAGTWAPTSRGQQNPIIIAVTNKELRDRISRMNSDIITGNKLVTSTPPGADPFYGAPCMLIVLVKESPNAMYDGPIVMQTLMLAAESLGVNSIWIHRAKEEFESEEGKQILADLGIEGNYVGIGNCILGYTAGEYPEAKPRKENWVYWVK